ncbi:gonadal somatic cell derived factor [Scyliorhinus canicula]|uniref:gonadal somatic cell derived factor n=1 Tax=Scyliorhinus canicula TaxID=7830 RepID=UPI0018F3AE0F|nr:gonadal somatic cell derived factor [Scyliorhinus canicula]
MSRRRLTPDKRQLKCSRELTECYWKSFVLRTYGSLEERGSTTEGYARGMELLKRSMSWNCSSKECMKRSQALDCGNIPSEDSVSAVSSAQSQSGALVREANETTTPTSPKICCQTAAQISLTDLGWDHWIVYPEQITYVACASCRHARDVVSPRCPQDRPSSRSKAPRRSCCKAVKTAWIPIVYVDEDLSLVTSNIPLTEECGW